MNTDRFGFSTGALERRDYRAALGWVRNHRMGSVELSALRYDELEPLVDDLDNLVVTEFHYVSFHAPSSFLREQETQVVSLLERVLARQWNIIVHPDVIYTPKLWHRFGSFLLVENMDRRKSTGRTVRELAGLFEQLPDARMCLDVAHARQLDTTLTLLSDLVRSFADRIAEVHISELDSHCRHRPLSSGAVVDYRKVAALLRNVPIIIESMLDDRDSQLRQQEMRFARQAME